jgi:phosphatidate phosphatase LPIN
VVIIKGNEFPMKRDQLASDIHFFSDGEIGPQQTRPTSPIQSDTEFEVSQRDKGDNTSSQIEWKWGQPVVEETGQKESADSNKRNSMLSGMLSFMKQKRKNNVDGLYLSQLDAEDPEIAALYFPPNGKDKNEANKKGGDEDRESGNGTSLPQSPSNSLEVLKSDSENEMSKSKTDFSLNFVALSLCGGLSGDSNLEPSEEDFNANIIQYADVCQNPSIFSSQNLVVRINNKYYSWAVACPYIMTLVAYQKPLPDAVCEKILHVTKEKPLALMDNREDQNQSIQIINESQRRSWFSWRRSGTQDQNIKSPMIDSQPPPPEDVLNSIKENDYAVSESLSEKRIHANGSVEMYRKTLRLSSKQIESLDLKDGINEVEFSVTTAYQGTSRCKCYLFKWKHSDRVIISDIDGTITRKFLVA